MTTLLTLIPTPTMTASPTTLTETDANDDPDRADQDELEDAGDGGFQAPVRAGEKCITAAVLCDVGV